MADINDRLDRLHRREAFDRRVAEPGTSVPADEPRPAGTAAAPEVAAPGSAPQWSRSGLPQRGPVPPGPAQPGAAEQRSRSGLPQRVPAHPTPTPAGSPPPHRSMPVAPTQPAGPHQWSRSGLPQRSPAPAVAAGGSAHLAPADSPQLVQGGGGSAQLATAEPVHVVDRQPAPKSPPTPRPAGVDDRLGEVLDAVAEVVRRHPGLSVMVALADGRAGRPVIRVTERDGAVDTGLVVPGAESRPRPEPGREPERESRRPGGRHAAPAADDPGHGEPASGPEAGADPAGSPPARASWHDSLWSAGRAGAAADAVPDHRAEHGALRLVPDLEPAAGTGTSQVVSRLAQLLREDPSLASSWGREAPEG